MGERPVLRALVEMIDAPAYTEIKAEQQYDKMAAILRQYLDMEAIYRIVEAGV